MEIIDSVTFLPIPPQRVVSVGTLRVDLRELTKTIVTLDCTLSSSTPTVNLLLMCPMLSALPYLELEKLKQRMVCYKEEESRFILYAEHTYFVPFWYSLEDFFSYLTSTTVVGNHAFLVNGRSLLTYDKHTLFNLVVKRGDMLTMHESDNLTELIEISRYGLNGMMASAYKNKLSKLHNAYEDRKYIYSSPTVLEKIMHCKMKHGLTYILQQKFPEMNRVTLAEIVIDAAFDNSFDTAKEVVDEVAEKLGIEYEELYSLVCEWEASLYENSSCVGYEKVLMNCKRSSWGLCYPDDFDQFITHSESLSNTIRDAVIIDSIYIFEVLYRPDLLSDNIKSYLERIARI